MHIHPILALVASVLCYKGFSSFLINLVLAYGRQRLKCVVGWGRTRWKTTGFALLLGVLANDVAWSFFRLLPANDDLVAANNGLVWANYGLSAANETYIRNGGGIRLCLVEKMLLWREIFWWASIRFKRLTGQHHTSGYNPCRWGLNLLCSAVLIGWGSIVVAFVGSDFGAFWLTFNRAYERD